MKIVAISDTHGFHRRFVIPNADVLIHAGDITGSGELEIVRDFAAWLESLPHKHKIVVPGNHDFCFDISKSRYDERAVAAVRGAAHLLIDASVTIDGFKIYGSPWVPNLAMWAFYDRGRDRFRDAPTDIDVLVTHGPPDGVRDKAFDADGVEVSQSAMMWLNPHVGSRPLLEYVRRCPRLQAHVFGHVHEGYGQICGAPRFVNAAVCTREYEPTNPPIVFEVEPRSL